MTRNDQGRVDLSGLEKSVEIQWPTVKSLPATTSSLQWVPDPTRLLTEQFIRVANFLSESLFGNRIRPYIITPQRVPGLAGFFAPQRFQTRDGSTVFDQIGINIEILHLLTFTELCALIAHELNHGLQFHYGHYSPNGYHNLQFAEWAARIGLYVSHTGAPGGRRTGVRMGHFLDPNGAVARASWHGQGSEELKRAGLDISGGPGARIKTSVFLIVRIGILSVGLAEMTAIMFSILFFSKDINEQMQLDFLRTNAHVFSAASALVDADIQRANVAVKTQAARVDSLSAQITSLRQHDIEPGANDPQILQAEQEVNRLIEEKTRADDAVVTAQNFASMELGGVKIAPGNTGIVGNGPHYRAAMAAVETAKQHAQEVAASLEAARSRLNELRKQLASSDKAEQERSHGELPGYEATLASEEAKLANLKAQLDSLIKGREDAIRHGVESAPDYVPLNNGFLAQVAALDEVARKNTQVHTFKLLIELISFGFELSALLAKTASALPSEYARLAARDAYLRAVRIVDELVAELNKGPATENEITFPPPPPPATDNQRNGGSSGESDPFSDLDNPAPLPPKRPRGRPRKHPINNREIKSAHRKAS